MAVPWLAIGSAGLGALNAMANRDAAKQQDRYRQEVLRYSPWLNMPDPGGFQGQTDPLMGALGGATSMLGADQAAQQAGGYMNYLGLGGVSPEDAKAAGEAAAAGAQSGKAMDSQMINTTLDPSKMKMPQDSGMAYNRPNYLMNYSGQQVPESFWALV